MDNIIVTRHQGLVDWLSEHNITGKVIDRATPNDVMGKNVIGKIPVPLAAIAESLTIVYIPGVPEERWNKELTAYDLNKYGAYMRTYKIKEIETIEGD
jgi:putative CRISPR-associated protein (TIGR02620 family)